MTLDHEVTEVPTDIVSALGLRVGTSYSGQIVTRDCVVHLREGSVAPAIDAPAHIIVPREPFTVRPAGGEGIYLWTVAGGPGVLVLTTAP